MCFGAPLELVIAMGLLLGEVLGECLGDLLSSSPILKR